MNLAQKLRPMTFDDVVGHEKTIKELKKRCKEQSFPQVIFLIGNTGTGKTTLQRIIAKSMLCLDKTEEGYGCGICKTCEAIDNEKPLELIGLLQVEIDKFSYSEGVLNGRG